MVFVNVNISTQIVVGALLLLRAMSGCTLLDTETPRGWPPKPGMPPDVGTRHGHGCQVLHILVGPPYEADLRIDVASEFSKQHAASWKESKLEMTARSPWASYEDFLPEPVVFNSTTRPELAYYFSHPATEESVDSNDEAFDGLLIPDVRPGRWYPWEVTGRVSSGNPALDGLGLLDGGRTVERGWVLVDANEHDDHVWFSGPDGNVTKTRWFHVALPGDEHVTLSDSIVCP